jgi:hypothetical protein
MRSDTFKKITSRALSLFHLSLFLSLSFFLSLSLYLFLHLEIEALFKRPPGLVIVNGSPPLRRLWPPPLIHRTTFSRHHKPPALTKTWLIFRSACGHAASPGG